MRILCAPMLLCLSCSFGCCARILVPLCPKLAEESYDPPKRGAVVNRYMQAEADRRHIEIHVVSPFVAALQGTPWDIGWFRHHYVFMVCGFDPHNVIEDEAVGMTCLRRAKRWLELIESSAPEDVLLKEAEYGPICIP